MLNSYFDYELPPLETLAIELKAYRPIDRKQRCDEMLARGELQLKDFTNERRKAMKGFDVFVYCGVQFPYIKCVTCGFYVSGSNGGHKTLHIRQECLKKIQTFSHPQLSSCEEEMKPFNLLQSAEKPRNSNFQDILQLVADYCLKTGMPFENANSEAFCQLITGVAGGSADVPVSSELEDYCEDFKYPHMFRDVSIKVSDYIRSKSAQIFVDYGRNVKDWISAFVCFVKDQDEEYSMVEVCPLGFTEIFRCRSSEELTDWLVECAGRLGISREEILMLNVNVDGIIKAEGFQSCNTTGVSRISQLFDSILSPEISKENFSSDEIKDLQKCRELLDEMYAVSRKLNPSTPSHPFIDYRLKFHYAQQLYDNQGEEKLERIDWKKFADIREVLSKFEPLFRVFAKNDVSIHHFLPKFTALNDQFSQELKKYSEEFGMKRVLLRAAKLVVQRFLDQEISEIHYKTTMLSPGHRRMSRLSQNAKQKAMDLIRKELENVPETQTSLKTPNKKEKETPEFDDDYDEPISSEHNDELQTYLEEVTLNRDEPLVFWTKRRRDFPRLSQVAFRCFSVICTENLTRKIFGKIRKIVGDEKHGDQMEKRVFALLSYNDDF